MADSTNARLRIRLRHGDHLPADDPETLRLALGRDHDRRRLVGPVDGHLLGHVVGGGAAQPGRAHQDQRLAGQVDVLLVLGGVAGDRPVAQLGQLDADLGGGDPVRPAADHGPVAPGRGHGCGDAADLLPPGQHLLHGRRAAPAGPAASGRSRSAAPSPPPATLGQGPGQQPAGGHLGVERLGRRHAHLDVPAVGGVAARRGPWRPGRCCGG